MQTQHQSKICPGLSRFSKKFKTGGKQWWPLICDPMARVQAMVTTHLGGAAVRPAVMVREIPHLEGSVDGGDGGNRRRRVGVVHGLSRRSRGGLFSRRRARWPPWVLNGDGVLPASILA